MSIFQNRDLLNRADPVGPLSINGREVGYIYKVRVICDDGKDAIAVRRYEESVKWELRAKNRHNKRRRRCVVKIKPQSEMRVAWSCVKYNIRLGRGLGVAPEAFGATDALFATRGQALDVVGKFGMTFSEARQ